MQAMIDMPSAIWKLVIKCYASHVATRTHVLCVQDFDMALFVASVDSWKHFETKEKLLAFIEHEFGFTEDQVTVYMVKVQIYLKANPHLMILTANSGRNVRQILQWFECIVPFILSIYDWRAEYAFETYHLKVTPDQFSALHRVLCKGKSLQKECADHDMPVERFAELEASVTTNILAAVYAHCTKANWIEANIHCPYIFVDDSRSECRSVAAIGGKVLRIDRPDRVEHGAPRDICQYGQFNNHPVLSKAPATDPSTLL